MDLKAHFQLLSLWSLISCFFLLGEHTPIQTAVRMDNARADTSDVQHGSDDAADEHICEQCEESGLSVVASALCTVCNDYLCSSCVDQHKKLRSSKNHKLLEGADMPKQKPVDTEGLECSEHPGEIIKLVCQSDDVLCCVLCVTESHRTCSNVTSISRLSKNVVQSEQLEDVKKSAREQKEMFDSCRKLIDEYRRLNGKWCDQSMDRFTDFRDSIKECLERLGTKVIADAENLKQANELKLSSFEESLKSVERELESSVTNIELNEATRQMDELYISMKKSIKPIRENWEKVDQLKKEICIDRYTFGVDSTVKQSLEKMISTGPVQELSECMELLWEVDATLLGDENTFDGCFTLIVSPSELVVGDVENECLKLFDFNDGSLVENRDLESTPAGMTLIPDNRIAVCLPEIEQIHYFDGGNLEPRGCIDVKGACMSIDSMEKTMAVSFKEPNKVEILDFSGNVLKSFSTDASGGQLFCEDGDLTDVSFSLDERYIYVCEEERVTCLSNDGSVQWRYGEDRLEGAVGITSAPDGCIYVADAVSNTVSIVSRDGILLNIICLDSDRPLRVWYCDEDNMIYVMMESEDSDGALKCLRFGQVKDDVYEDQSTHDDD